MTSKKHIGITHAKHSATSKTILTKMHVHLFYMNVYIFYLRFALGIIHGDRCDRKTPKQIILFKSNPFFRSLNLGTLLLFEETIVLTSYLRRLK